jgi:hypothetical protein
MSDPIGKVEKYLIRNKSDDFEWSSLISFFQDRTEAPTESTISGMAWRALAACGSAGFGLSSNGWSGGGLDRSSPAAEGDGAGRTEQPPSSVCAIFLRFADPSGVVSAHRYVLMQPWIGEIKI